MTAPERAEIRRRIDQVRRERLRAELLASGEPLLCERCSAPMGPHPYGTPKRFCSDHCRRTAWYKTERGRAVKVLMKRRHRRKRGVPRRPGAEVAL